MIYHYAIQVKSVTSSFGDRDYFSSNFDGIVEFKKIETQKDYKKIKDLIIQNLPSVRGTPCEYNLLNLSVLSK